MISSNADPATEIYKIRKVEPFIKFPKRLKVKIKYIILAKKLKTRINSILIDDEKFEVECYDLKDFNKFISDLFIDNENSIRGK